MQPASIIVIVIIIILVIIIVIILIIIVIILVIIIIVWPLSIDYALVKVKGRVAWPPTFHCLYFSYRISLKRFSQLPIAVLCFYVHYLNRHLSQLLGFK